MKRGFTLIEILIVIGLIASLAMITVPVYDNWGLKTSINEAEYNIIEALRLAQEKSIANDLNFSWGVHFSGNHIIVFKGNVFSSDDQDNISYKFDSEAVTATTDFGDDLLFSKYIGIPSAIGETAIGKITIRLDGDDKKIINVNGLGMSEESEEEI